MSSVEWILRNRSLRSKPTYDWGEEEEEEERRVEQQDVTLLPRRSAQDGDEPRDATTNDADADADGGLWDKAWSWVGVGEPSGGVW